MDYITVKQAAEMLGTSEHFVLMELRRKNLRGAKLPGRAGWRLRAEDVTKYVDAHMDVREVRRPRPGPAPMTYEEARRAYRG